MQHKHVIPAEHFGYYHRSVKRMDHKKKDDTKSQPVDIPSSENNKYTRIKSYGGINSCESLSPESPPLIENPALIYLSVRPVQPDANDIILN